MDTRERLSGSKLFGSTRLLNTGTERQPRSISSLGPTMSERIANPESFPKFQKCPLLGFRVARFATQSSAISSNFSVNNAYV